MTLSIFNGGLVSDIATYLQTIQSDVNSLWASNAVTWPVSFRTISLDDTNITTVDVPIELYAITPNLSSSLEELLTGREGMIRILLFDGNITVVNGTILTKDSEDFPAQSGDVMILINRGGSPETVIEGTWKEIYRLVSV